MGQISADAEHSVFLRNSEIAQLTYDLYHSYWESALETGGFRLVGTDLVNGRPCCAIEGRAGVWEEMGRVGSPVKVWIDPERGFAVAKLEVYDNGTGELNRFNSFDVIEMKNIEDDLWVPVHVLFQNGKEVVVEEIGINEDLPEDFFTIKFPEGTRVTDKIAGMTYFVDPSVLMKTDADEPGPGVPLLSEEQLDALFDKVDAEPVEKSSPTSPLASDTQVARPGPHPALRRPRFPVFAVIAGVVLALAVVVGGMRLRKTRRTN